LVQNLDIKGREGGKGKFEAVFGSRSINIKF
jgi:hypothetical protein